MEIITRAENITEDMIKKFLMIILFFTDNEYSSINRFFICSEETYGQTIKEIDINSDFTDLVNYKGYGKTIKFDKYKSDIIIREEIFLALMKSINIEDNNASISDRSSLKSILHEIGHSQNNNEILISREYYWSKTSLKKLLNQHYIIERDEYLAEFYANDLLIKKIKIDCDPNLYFDINSEEILLDEEETDIKRIYSYNHDNRELFDNAIYKLHMAYLRPIILKRSYLDALMNNKVSLTNEINPIIERIGEFDIVKSENYNLRYFKFWKTMMRRFGINIKENGEDIPLKNCFDVTNNE